MNKRLKTIIITLCLCLSVNVSFSSEADKPVQDTGTKKIYAEHVFDARVTIGEMLDFGKSKYGERRIIPITGGAFSGPDIEDEVIPGGADWHLTRPDGDEELYARYTLKTNDGVLIHVMRRESEFLYNRIFSKDIPHCYALTGF